MYEEFWGLKEKPFENTPDPRFLYNSNQHEEALSRLLYVIRERKGAGMLTGVFGCGKTLIAKTILAELGRDIYRVSLVTNPRLNDVELLRMIGYQLGGEVLQTTKSDVLISLENVLLNNIRDGKNTVVIIDEAHSIENREVFEEIRLLLNFQHEDKFLLTVLLLGQPELREKIDANKQLSQRIALKYHLQGLSKEEAGFYIEHRIKVAGGKKDIFKQEAKELIFENSAGIPRRINQICDMALFLGFGKKIKSVEKEMVRESLAGLEG
ncbi:hypothetical protein AUJ66_01885 [Candidatus Desantisbacteria bacterium CG1_02_38_46]|uniref:AAA+ ATPase domain-containing protein n=1 Tax=Candidatus Desantisbacteria bacterium CG1_02_38_46 TaxID=1817893 RepID=A0A1J4SET2_9BACT|nr:MAG: hypothetical protein AUJ66_01885 [Candidatus Desantisbacteria bacterium CG1_02_38_46]